MVIQMDKSLSVRLKGGGEQLLSTKEQRPKSRMKVSALSSWNGQELGKDAL